MKKKLSGQALLLLAVGLVILSIGMTICKRTGLGIGPYYAMMIGISKHVSLSPGHLMLIGNIMLGCLIWWRKPDLIAPGTIITGFFIGYVFDGVDALMPSAWFISSDLVWQIASFSLGIVIMTLGVAIYMEADLGFAPYDCVAYLFTKTAQDPASIYRNLVDGTAALLAFVLGGPIALGTLIFAFCVGPLIDFYRKWLQNFLRNPENSTLCQVDCKNISM